MQSAAKGRAAGDGRTCSPDWADILGSNGGKTDQQTVPRAAHGVFLVPLVCARLNDESVGRAGERGRKGPDCPNPRRVLTAGAPSAKHEDSIQSIQCMGQSLPI